MRASKMAGVIFFSGLAALIAASPGRAQEPKQTEQTQPSRGQKATPAAPREEPEPQAQASTAPAALPTYRPPLRGAPGGRVGGGTRGTGREVFLLSALAPDHTGLTVHEQPTLYWFISRPTTFPVELTVVDPQGTQPVLEVKIPSPVQAGVHRLRLADHGVRLAPGVAYRWYVAVVPDPDRRSRDILAGGAIERVDIPDELRKKLAQAETGAVPFLYAQAGMWYDALAAISELVEAEPNEPAFRQQRTALLAQVGLAEIGQ